MKNAVLLQGDCLEVMKELDSESFDSLVTDPPAGISFMGKNWDSDKGGREQWIKWMSEVMREVYRVLKPGAHGLVWALPRTSHWTATALEDAGFEIRDVVTHLFGSGFPKSLNVAKAGAKEWQGWGTALKPASEHWILVRKPLSEKTVAKNVQRWGTGAINIDASRVGFASEADFKRNNVKTPGMRESESDFWQGQRVSNNPTGRFPANLVLSHTPYCSDTQCDIECAIQRLDAQSGAIKSGASRFFYCAKVSASERGDGNTHPTVKAQKLMAYFCKMITPPGGAVLDPFMGSGSTGIAATKEGFVFVGIEKEPEYFEIAEKRIMASEGSIEKTSEVEEFTIASDTDMRYDSA